MGLQLTQQVNLFQSDFHERRDVVCAKNVQNAVLVIIAILVLLSVYDFIRDNSQSNYLIELRTQQIELAKKLQMAKNTAPSMVVDVKLQQQVSSFKNDIETKQQVLDALSGQSFGNTSGFSVFFKGLAEQSVSGLWLTNLNIRNGGKEIAITGSAFQPELIPDFISNLADERVFQGTSFQTFRVKRETDPERVDFYVDTQFEDIAP